MNVRSSQELRDEGWEGKQAWQQCFCEVLFHSPGRPELFPVFHDIIVGSETCSINYVFLFFSTSKYFGGGGGMRLGVFRFPYRR